MLFSSAPSSGVFFLRFGCTAVALARPNVGGCVLPIVWVIAIGNWTCEWYQAIVCSSCVVRVGFTECSTATAVVAFVAKACSAVVHLLYRGCSWRRYPWSGNLR